MKTVNISCQNQNQEGEEEECTMIFILVHLKLELHPILTLHDEIWLTLLVTVRLTTIGFQQLVSSLTRLET